MSYKYLNINYALLGKREVRVKSVLHYNNNMSYPEVDVTIL